MDVLLVEADEGVSVCAVQKLGRDLEQRIRVCLEHANELGLDHPTKGQGRGHFMEGAEGLGDVGAAMRRAEEDLCKTLLVVVSAIWRSIH